MFTGIIEAKARVKRVESQGSGARLWLENPFGKVSLGESIAVDGVCLTADDQSTPETLSFFLSEETLQRTRFTALSRAEAQAGHALNLERALLPTTRLSGHYVSGHVDGLATVVSVREDAGAYDLKVRIPRSHSRYCVEKGSIALNGVSLTINALEDAPNGTELGLKLVPHTWAMTGFDQFKAGDALHFEADVLAKFVERLMKERA